jgi:glycosyltransferase involved in cell wall biosynthesis
VKLSIIIPCYNEKSTIKKILLKVLSVKKIKNKQIILIDDFSNDGSVKDLDLNKWEWSTIPVNNGLTILRKK